MQCSAAQRSAISDRAASTGLPDAGSPAPHFGPHRGDVRRNRAQEGKAKQMKRIRPRDPHYIYKGTNKKKPLFNIVTIASIGGGGEVPSTWALAVTSDELLLHDCSGLSLTFLNMGMYGHGKSSNLMPPRKLTARPFWPNIHTIHPRPPSPGCSLHTCVLGGFFFPFRFFCLASGNDPSLIISNKEKRIA